jgi:hypothetical protein
MTDFGFISSCTVIPAGEGSSPADIFFLSFKPYPLCMGLLPSTGFLVPKLSLGTILGAKLCFAHYFDNSVELLSNPYFAMPHPLPAVANPFSGRTIWQKL